MCENSISSILFAAVQLLASRAFPAIISAVNIDEINTTFFFLSNAIPETEAEKNKKKRKVAVRNFTEGWVEFESKKVAKKVAAVLNNTQVSTRKKSKFYDIIWNIKYLPRYSRKFSEHE